MEEYPVKEVLAFAWHVTDGVVQLKVNSRKTKALWAGIGVGWSLFWLVRYYTGPKKLVETKPRR